MAITVQSVVGENLCKRNLTFSLKLSYYIFLRLLYLFVFAVRGTPAKNHWAKFVIRNIISAFLELTCQFSPSYLFNRDIL
jgi:hypothetical protein